MLGYPEKYDRFPPETQPRNPKPNATNGIDVGNI